MPFFLFVAFSILLVLGRAVLVGALLCSGTITGGLLAAVGAIGVATTVVAWVNGRADQSWGGLAVGVGYLVHLVMVPGETHLAFVGPLFWVIFAAQCWVRVHLGRCCTLTGPVFVQVKESGPYAWVRHPMAATGLLMAIVFAVEFPSSWNVAALVVIAAVDVWCCLMEERFLMREAAYRDYSSRVPWRLLPGVW